MKATIFLSKSILLELICSLFIILFVYTAISKLTNVAQFRSVLGSSPLIGNYAAITAWTIPIIELLVSGLLFMKNTKKIGLYSSFFLMLGFTSYLIYMIYFTPNLPCSCGGVLTQLTWKQHLLFNAFFLLLSVGGILIASKIEKNDVSPESMIAKT